jgi:transposase
MQIVVPESADIQRLRPGGLGVLDHTDGSVRERDQTVGGESRIAEQILGVGHPGFVGGLIRREDQVMARKSPYSAELRRRAVAMVADVRSEYDTEFAAVTSVARQLGIGSAETLRKWVRQAEVDAGIRPGTSREEAAEIRVLKRRVAELERVNEILKAASSYFARELDFKL